MLRMRVSSRSFSRADFEAWLGVEAPFEGMVVGRFGRGQGSRGENQVSGSSRVGQDGLRRWWILFQRWSRMERAELGEGGGRGRTSQFWTRSHLRVTNLSALTRGNQIVSSLACQRVCVVERHQGRHFLRQAAPLRSSERVKRRLATPEKLLALVRGPPQSLRSKVLRSPLDTGSLRGSF